LADAGNIFAIGDGGFARRFFLQKDVSFGIDPNPSSIFFAKALAGISLMCEQTPQPGKPNRGITPLPQLDRRYFAARIEANSGVGLHLSSYSREIAAKLAEIQVRRTQVDCERSPFRRKKMQTMNHLAAGELNLLLKEKCGLPAEISRMLADWNIRNPDDICPWLHPGWVFSSRSGLADPDECDFQFIFSLIQENASASMKNMSDLLSACMSLARNGATAIFCSTLGAKKLQSLFQSSGQNFSIERIDSIRRDGVRSVFAGVIKKR
jgi:hypothetical protein